MSTEFILQFIDNEERKNFELLMVVNVVWKMAILSKQN